MYLGLGGVFRSSLEKYSRNPALMIEDRYYSYEQLGMAAFHVAQAINRCEAWNDASLVAVLGQRNFPTYAGILGILLSGRGYVPLNPKFPLKRTLRMINLSTISTMIICEETKLLEEILSELDSQVNLIIVAPGFKYDKIRDYSRRFPQHQFDYVDLFDCNMSTVPLRAVKKDSPAYLLFTSGTTGTPKGIAVSHWNVMSYLEYILGRYDIHENDRITQTFDLTFDLSVHDMFLCWANGACLCPVPEPVAFTAAKFIRDNRITVWFSVPSVVMFMKRMRLLKENGFPTLRYSFFCGEALPEMLVEAWHEAAPTSIIENLYGPTETTIAITHYRWDPATSPRECLNGIVPIGYVFGSQKARVVGPDGNDVAIGEMGELYLSGSQVTNGYWNAPQKTKENFFRDQESGRLWYKTGDLVKKDGKGCLYYLGRSDEQVKILGHRAELQEVDSCLRKASGTELAIAIAWPIRNGIAEGIYGFIHKDFEETEHKIIEMCNRLLPPYMVPRRLFFIDQFPKNVNGKIDRKVLAKWIEERLK